MEKEAEKKIFEEEEETEEKKEFSNASVIKIKKDNQYKKHEKSKPVQENAPPEETTPKEKHLLEKEIDIKIKPKLIFKIGGLVLILAFVFFVGRWSSLEDPFSGISSFATSLIPDSEEIENEETNLTEEDNETESEVELVEEVEEETTEEEVEEEEIEEEEEPIITEYRNVGLTLRTAVRDWKGTWGKITRLDFSIKNSELGTIQADHFIMNVEGYDFDKIIPITIDDIKSKSTLSTGVVVPKGFSYSAVSAGDLNGVTIALYLYDSKDVLMDSFTGQFDLSG